MNDKTDREIMQQALNDLEALVAYIKGGEPDLFMQVPSIEALRERLAQPEQEPVLQDIEQYRMQMASISTAAIGYWKEGDGIHPDYDTAALRDVAMLYAKYDALYKAQPEQEPVAWCIVENGRVHGLVKTKPAVMNAEKWQPLYTTPQQRKPLTDEEKLIDLLEAARETFKKSPSGSECSQNAAYVHSVLETMLIKREWQGLTNEEVGALTVFDGLHHVEIPILANFVWAVEAKLKEKNT